MMDIFSEFLIDEASAVEEDWKTELDKTAFDLESVRAQLRTGANEDLDKE